MVPLASSLYVRANNLTLSTLLQSLSLAAYFARKSGGQVTFVHSPREPETQRLLNFSTLTVGKDEVAKALIANQPHRTTFSERAMLDSVGLLYETEPGNRGAGLADVADLVGLNLEVSTTRDREKKVLQKGYLQRNDENNSTTIEFKVERRKAEALLRPNRRLAPNYSSESRLAADMTNFGGFSGNISVR